MADSGAGSTTAVHPLFHFFGKFGALRRLQHLGGIGDGLGHPFGRSFSQFKFGGAQRFDGIAVYRGRREELGGLGARGFVLVAQGYQVFQGSLGDVTDLGFLGRSGIDIGQLARSAFAR